MKYKIKWFGPIFLLVGVASFIFFREPKKLDVPIPLVSFENSPSKYIEAVIEGEKYLFEIDTAAPSELTLKRELLNKLRNKLEVGKVEWVDINGNHYTSTQYEIPYISIGKIRLSNVTIKEERQEFLLFGAALDQNKPINVEWESHANKISGRIGAGFFRSWDCWLIDFPHGRISAIRNKKKIPSNWIRVNLEPTTPHFVVSLNDHKFALDSDAEVSFFRSKATDSFTTLKECVLNGHNFGTLQFWPVNLPEDFTDFDGVIGLDFIDKHPFYLNTKENYIMIPPN